MANIILKILLRALDAKRWDSGTIVNADGIFCDKCGEFIPNNEIAYGAIDYLDIHGMTQGARQTANTLLICFRCAEVDRQVIDDNIKLGYQYVQLRVAFNDI